MHDTFFLKQPSDCREIPQDYMNRVSGVHSKGGYGSKGYGYDWQEGEARKNILRTHTTAISSQMLYKLAQQKEFKPIKYFSIDRVFRNETLDATHLAEFHQCEGMVVDRNIGLSHLMGIINEFYRKIGITNIKFKPAYNPYTEPSLEIFGYHPTLKRWVEIGNSGVFRPEMLRPMGLPEDVNVIAWGLSLERPTMIQYQLNNIRDLFGHKVPLSSTKQNKICYILE
jgi:phenylalanyl-tRNA synthetase alpha chain